MSAYGIATPVSLADMPQPRVRPATVVATGPNAASPAANPVAPAPAMPATGEVVTSEVDRRDRPSIRSFIPENLRNTLGDAAVGVAGADPRAGPVGAFAQAFAGAQGNATARSDKEAAATLAADERAYQRSRDTVSDARATREDERADRRLTLDEIKAKAEAGGKYVNPDGTDLTPDGWFKVMDLSKSYHSELVKSFGLSGSRYSGNRKKDITRINEMVAAYQEQVRQAVLAGKDPSSVAKPGSPGTDVPADGGGKKGKKRKDAALEPTDETALGAPGKADAATPTPAALKLTGSGTREDPYSGFSTVEQFRAKVPINGFYLDEDGDISQRLK